VETSVADKESRGLALWREAGTAQVPVGPGRSPGRGGTGAVGSKQVRLDLGSVVGGVGENQAGAKAEGGAGGLKRIPAGGDVVDEISLAERQSFAGAGHVVLVGRDGAEGLLVARALGLDRMGSGDGSGNLGAWAMGGDHAGKAGVGVGVASAVGDGDKPARAGD